jgi:RHS repeat-associated protein
MTIVMVIHYGLKGRNGLVKGRKRRENETRLIALLNYRKLTVEDFALNGYACEDYTETDPPDCPPDTLGIASGSLALIRDSMSNKTPQTIQIPNQLHRIELCDGREDHLLNEEISQLQGDYVITQTIDIPDTLQTYATATASGVSQQSLEAILALRSSGQALYLEGFEPPNIPGNPGTDVWNGGDPFGSVLSELREAIQPEVSYYIQDHLGNTRVMYHTDLVSCQDYDVLYRLEHVLDYYPYGRTLREYVPGPREKFQSTEHERDLETGLDHRGARMYDGDVGRFLGVDPLAGDFPSWSSYSYTFNNPIRFMDPDGRAPEEYPIIRITKQKTGKTADQRVLGYSGGVTTQVDLYKVEVTDTEDPDFKMEFSITRDAWTVEKGGGNMASNVAFEPKDGDVNHFTGEVMLNGFPQGNGTEALKLTQYGSEVVHAEANQTSVKMGYRNKEDVAAGVMIHVGGNYQKGGNNRVAASEGCFGICNPGNSSSKPSNNYSNNILTKIKAQANKSQTNPGHIRVIIEKREGNEYPTTKKVN